MEFKFLEQISWNKQLLKKQEVKTTDMVSSSCAPEKKICTNGDGSGSGKCVPSYTVTKIPGPSVVTGKNIQVTVSFGCSGFGSPRTARGDSTSSCRAPPEKEYSNVFESPCPSTPPGPPEEGEGTVGGFGGTGECTRVCVGTAKKVVPCDCYAVNIKVLQLSLDDATGNSDVYKDNKVFLEYLNCGGKLLTKVYYNAGLYVRDVCTGHPASLYYYKNNIRVETFEVSEDGCCLCSCFNINVDIDQSDLNDATGNNDTSKNHKIFLKYKACSNMVAHQTFTIAGYFENTACAKDILGLYYYKNNKVKTCKNASRKVMEGECC